MKKIIWVLLILVLVSTTVFSRPVKRIIFPKGATVVNVMGYLKGYTDSQTYLIRLKAGQKFTVQATKNVSVYITDPRGNDVSDMDLSCHSRQTIKKTIAGDYKIIVKECGKTDEWKGNIKLTIKVKR